MNLAKLEAVMFTSFAAAFGSLVVIAGATQFQPAATETVQLEPVVITAAAKARNG